MKNEIEKGKTNCVVSLNTNLGMFNLSNKELNFAERLLTSLGIEYAVGHFLYIVGEDGELKVLK